MPTYLSLFSGVGGLDLAVEAHGFTCVGQVEYDPACTAVLKRWWPDVPRWGDVHEFTAAAYADAGRPLAVGAPAGHAIAAESRRDDIVGLGTSDPATPDAGRRQLQRWSEPGGMEGEIGEDGEETRVQGDRDAWDSSGDGGEVDLIIGGYPCQPFSHAGRRGGTDDPRHLWPEFARLIGEFRPRLVLLENVPGHLSLGAPEVLADLAALGYDATWTTLRASDVGAPHRRERWFCLAERTDADGERRGVGGSGPLAEGDRGEPQPGAGGLGEDATDPGIGQLTRASADGNGLSELAERGAVAHGSAGQKMKPRDFRLQAAAMSAEPREEPSTSFTWGQYLPAIRRWERVMGPAPHPVDERSRLAPTFVEWMMGFPAGWTEGLTRTQALKALGNAVVPQQGAEAIARLVAMA